ncbi:MAG TPA: BTAD domain-containing putative transcriptional regulator, partial [Fimbriimonadaceae bacterium]|nr:BTAD domain-containing putative transcriptional regulator [Fimbriimonadaceae bacterium]
MNEWVSVDCTEFQRLAASGSEEAAVACYRPLLPGWNEPWLASYRELYEGLFAETAARAAGNLSDESAIQVLSSACALHPLNENLLIELMGRLMRSGQQVRAVKAYEAYVAVLETQMRVSPGDAVRRLAEEAMQAKLPFEVARVRLSPAPLPNPITRMFGRESIIERTRDLVAASRRLITFTGIGGIGKTRVALEYAHREHSIETIAFASLVETSDIDGVFEVLQTSLGIPYGYGKPAEVVARALASRRAL